jgi:holo-[acyl-carrier protein] synthase
MPANCHPSIGNRDFHKIPRWRVTTLVGVDAQPIDEVEASVGTFGERYTQRLFTEHELERCGNEPSVAAMGLAAHFAAKEAVLKILDTSTTFPSWRSIEVTRGKYQRPMIVLHAEAADMAREQGVTDLYLSLCRSGGIATAVVVARVTESRSEATR